MQDHYAHISTKYQMEQNRLSRDIDDAYRAAKRNRDPNHGPQMTYEEYNEAKHEIAWESAWQIFDEVNESNDTDKHIDLNCLSPDDATAIMK